MTGAELFERGARERPGEPALLYFDTAISFGEAGAAARALAAALRDELGVRPGDRVALVLQNVPQVPIAVHAAWLCGAIVTTVNPMGREAEVRGQLLDSGATVVVCLESLHGTVAAACAGTRVEHVVVASELEMLESVPAALAGHARVECPGAVPFADLCRGDRGGAAFEAAEVDPDSPAFLAYTSGTTGVPKGAIVSHRAVAHNATVMTEWWSLGRGDVTVGMAPLFHITGLICHLATAQASLTPLLLMYRFDPGEFLRLVERWRGTYSIGPLTAYVALLEHPDLGRRDISSLTKVASGGAPVHPAVVHRWEQSTGVYVHNTYGLTETAAPSHLVPFGQRAPVDPESGALSIGVPIPQAESRVIALDGEHEAPPGEPGEIVTRGPAVTPGYWNRPEESAAALRDGWLHTGDVGKRDADGWFYVVDRLKDMIVASGYKVWPRDVEDVLYRHPAVREAAVVGRPDPYRGETVVAYVALREGAAAGAAELIAHCRSQIAVYKAPHEVHLVEEIPKTPSGKALRRELRDRHG